MEKLFRVSEVLSIYKDFSGIDPNVLANKARLGTNVHASIQAFYDDLHLPSEGKEVGYFDSFLKWQEQEPSFPHIMETRFYGRSYYCGLTGQVDAVMNIKGVPTLVDFKCTHKADTLCWPLQAYYYIALLEENGILVSHDALFIKLDKDGNMPRLFWFNIDDEVMKLAIHTWEVFKAKNKITKI